MTDADQIRSAVSGVTQLKGELRARPGAASVIRAQAKARRRRTIALAVAALPVAGALVLLLSDVVGSDERRTIVPAAPLTPSASASPEVPSPVVSVPPGPRTLAVPIELRPVLEEYAQCPRDAGTVPAAEGAGCYRLGREALSIKRVSDLASSPALAPEGTVTSGATLLVTLTPPDATKLARLSGRQVGRQLALVVQDTVYSAPQIAERLNGGMFQLQLSESAADAFVTAVIK